MSIDGARIGPDGRYWLVDGGSSGVNQSTKLVGVNLTTDSVDKTYYLQDIRGSNGGIDDVRFGPSGDVAYLSDTDGAMLVLNLTTGEGVRVLADDDSAKAWFPMAYNGSLVPGYGASPSLSVGFDQMEVSPDGVYLYYQPCNGGLYRIETAYVDATLTNATLAASLGDYAAPFTLTPSTGGTTIEGDGSIYVSDTNLLAIWKVTPEGRTTILVQDDALIWTDLMWVTADKKLWLPASQMRPGADGLMADGPTTIFSRIQSMLDLLLSTMLRPGDMLNLVVGWIVVCLHGDSAGKAFLYISRREKAMHNASLKRRATDALVHTGVSYELDHFDYMTYIHFQRVDLVFESIAAVPLSEN